MILWKLIIFELKYIFWEIYVAQGIFSTYSQGENRVTSTIIQVLKNLPVNVVERFLIMFSETDTQNFFRFKNQVKGPDSIPDAEISAKFCLLFETKTVPNSVNEDQLSQLNSHLKIAEQKNATLVYLTPDQTIPKLLEDKGVVWKNFQDLFNLISELRTEPTLILSERDQFLLKNLQDFFSESELLPIIDEVVVVAASTAWPVYQKHSIYVCQAERSFRDVGLIGFYAEGGVQNLIAKINKRYEIEFSDDHLKDDTKMNTKLKNWLNDNDKEKGKRLQVFDLSGAKNDETTIDLKKTIPNDLKNESGRVYAFTQGQRYTSLSKLEKATTTSDL